MQIIQFIYNRIRKNTQDYKLCPVCNFSCNYIKYGTYKRYCINNIGEKSIINIQRLFCKKKDSTFSILPDNLIPYKIFSIDFIFNVMNILQYYKNFSSTKSLNKISESMPNASFLSPCHLQYFTKIIKTSMNKASFIFNKTYKTILDFITFCKDCKYRCLQGAVALNVLCYKKSQHFLFGISSQHRNLCKT